MTDTESTPPGRVLVRGEWEIEDDSGEGSAALWCTWCDHTAPWPADVTVDWGE